LVFHAGESELEMQLKALNNEFNYKEFSWTK